MFDFYFHYGWLFNVKAKNSWECWHTKLKLENWNLKGPNFAFKKLPAELFMRCTSRLESWDTSKKSQRLDVCLVVKMETLSKEVQLGIFLNYIILSEDEVFFKKNTQSDKVLDVWTGEKQAHGILSSFTPPSITICDDVMIYQISSQ